MQKSVILQAVLLLLVPIGNPAFSQSAGPEDVVNGYANDFQQVLGDLDGDGIDDASDNCPSIANADQLDTDADTVGDACDNCPSTANANQLNVDRDCAGGACDECDYDPARQVAGSCGCYEFEEVDPTQCGSGGVRAEGSRYLEIGVPQMQAVEVSVRVYSDSCPSGGFVVPLVDTSQLRGVLSPVESCFLAGLAPIAHIASEVIIPDTTYHVDYRLCNNGLPDPTAEWISIGSATTALLGDLDGNGVVNISDVLSAINANSCASGGNLFNADLVATTTACRPDAQITQEDLDAVIFATSSPFSDLCPYDVDSNGIIDLCEE